MLGEKTTVVISPLIALMKDQVESLPPVVRRATALINSTLTNEEMERRLIEIGEGSLKLVYVAPERFRNYRFLRTLRDAGVERLVIDEAHCISLWGHDFRPDYLFIPRALDELGDPPVLAMTATATPDMVDQIAAGLGRTLEVVRGSVFRSNLRYEVHHLARKEEKLARLVEICRNERGHGIVYVSSRRDTESIAALSRSRRRRAPLPRGLALEYPRRKPGTVHGRQGPRDGRDRRLRHGREQERCPFHHPPRRAAVTRSLFPGIGSSWSRRRSRALRATCFIA